MIFTEAAIHGSFVIDIEPHEDPRGFFARTWCEKEAREYGISANWVQSNTSFNKQKGTLRGMHYQYPDWEAKLVRVTRGAIFDAVTDLRPDSPSYLKCFTLELSGADHRQLFIPEGCAHGFLSLADNTEVCYLMSAFHDPSQARGFRWDDPRFAIPWPKGEKIISDRDRELPVFLP
jgi:dTDP-4-dehydrorhamnose 3,5-epimerase